MSVKKICGSNKFWASVTPAVNPFQKTQKCTEDTIKNKIFKGKFNHLVLLKTLKQKENMVIISFKRRLLHLRRSASVSLGNDRRLAISQMQTPTFNKVPYCRGIEHPLKARFGFFEHTAVT